MVNPLPEEIEAIIQRLQQAEVEAIQGIASAHYLQGQIHNAIRDLRNELPKYIAN